MLLLSALRGAYSGVVSFITSRALFVRCSLERTSSTSRVASSDSSDSVMKVLSAKKLAHGRVSLEDLPDGEQATMLSWRWGAEADREGRLREIMSLALDDTQCKYLWVDFYCIDQGAEDAMVKVMLAAVKYAEFPVYLSWLHPSFWNGDDSTRLWISREFTKASTDSTGNFDASRFFASLPQTVHAKSFTICLENCVRGHMAFFLKRSVRPDKHGCMSKLALQNEYERALAAQVYIPRTILPVFACLNLGSQCYSAADAQYCLVDIKHLMTPEQLHKAMKQVSSSEDPILTSALWLLRYIPSQMVLVDTRAPNGWMTAFTKRLRRYCDKMEVQLNVSKQHKYWTLTFGPREMKLWVNGQLANSNIDPASVFRRNGSY